MAEMRREMTWKQILDLGEDVLAKGNIAEAGLDAWYLFSHIFHMDKVHFLLDRGKKAPWEQEGFTEAFDSYQKLLEKRCRRIPLQHLLESQEFMGLSFFVNEHVLIPRQDTETLVEQVLKDHRGGKEAILDMCTGSGCIAISLERLGGYQKVVGADISEEALKVAQYNGRQLCGDQVKDGTLSFVKSDLFENIAGQFDIIVSNPPYIPSGVIAGLEPEVREYEPMAALDGKADGLYFYRELARESGRYLRPGGSVYFEIGYDQADAVRKLLRDAGYEKIDVIKDGPGLDRVVKAVLKMEVA